MKRGVKDSNLEGAKARFATTPKKSQYILVPNLEFEKKMDNNLVFSTKNVVKKLINSLIDN